MLDRQLDSTAPATIEKESTRFKGFLQYLQRCLLIRHLRRHLSSPRLSVSWPRLELALSSDRGGGVTAHVRIQLYYVCILYTQNVECVSPRVCVPVRVRV